MLLISATKTITVLVWPLAPFSALIHILYSSPADLSRDVKYLPLILLHLEANTFGLHSRTLTKFDGHFSWYQQWFLELGGDRDGGSNGINSCGINGCLENINQGARLRINKVWTATTKKDYLSHHHFAYK